MFPSYKTPAHSTHLQTSFNDVQIHGEENGSFEWYRDSIQETIGQ